MFYFQTLCCNFAIKAEIFASIQTLAVLCRIKKYFHNILRNLYSCLEKVFYFQTLCCNFAIKAEIFASIQTLAVLCRIKKYFHNILRNLYSCLEKTAQSRYDKYQNICESF